MLCLHMHIETVLVACHIVAMLALLSRQSATLETQMSPQILLIGVGFIATRTCVHTWLRWRRLHRMLQHYLVERGNRFHSQRPSRL